MAGMSWLQQSVGAPATVLPAQLNCDGSRRAAAWDANDRDRNDRKRREAADLGTGRGVRRIRTFGGMVKYHREPRMPCATAGSGDLHSLPIAATALASQPNVEREMGVARLREEFAAALAGRTDTSPLADQGAIAEQRRFDRQHIVARHVLGRVDPVKEDVEK